MNDTYSKTYAFMVIFIVAMGGALYGYDVGIINSILLYMVNDIPMNTGQIASIGSAVFAGATIATLVTGPLADWLGRKSMLFISSTMLLLGVAAVYNAHSYSILLGGRILQGLGVGIITMIAPLYISEVAAPAFRGRGTSLFQLFLTLGILGASIIGYLFSLGTGGDWHSMLLTYIGMAVIFIVGLLFIPKSPRWLTHKGRKDEALQILQKTLDVDDYSREVLEMDIREEQRNQPQVPIKQALKSKSMFFPVVLVMAIAIFHQLLGVCPVLQFSAMVLKSSGVSSNETTILGSIYVNGSNVIGTVIGLFLVDILGRKPLLSFGAGMASICLLIAGLSFSFGWSSNIILWAMILFLFFFAIGPGVVLWLVLAELLPNRIRSNAMAVALTLNALASTTTSAFFVWLGQSFDFAYSFYVSAFFCFLHFITACFFLPETKGKTLDEIEKIFTELYDPNKI